MPLTSTLNIYRVHKGLALAPAKLPSMSETVPLLSSSSNSGIHEVRKFLALLCVLFSLPYAASTIAVYDILYDAACKYHSISPDECLSSPESTQFVTSLFSVVSILNATLATVVLVAATIWSDRKGGRERGLVWFMGLCALAVISFPVMAYTFDAKITPWRMIVPYVLFALSGTPTLLLNLSMLHITDLVPEPSTRTKSLSLLVGFAMLTQSFAPGLGSSVLKTGISLKVYMLACGLWMSIGTLVFAFNLTPTSKGSVDNNDNTAAEQGNTSTQSDDDNQTDNSSEQADDRYETSDSSSIDSVPMSRASLKFLLSHLGIYDFLGVMKSRNAIIVALNFMLSNELAIGIIDLIMVYAKRAFGWEGPKVGQTLFMLFAVRTIWALVGFPVLYSKITNIWPAHPSEVDKADLVHMTLCNIITVVAYSVMATASTSSQYTAGVLLLANDGIVGTVWINSLIKQVPPSRKGAFMGGLSLVNKPAGAILPAIFMKVLQYTTDTNPSTVLWIIVGISVALTLSLSILKTSTPVVLY